MHQQYSRMRESSVKSLCICHVCFLIAFVHLIVTFLCVINQSTDSRFCVTQQNERAFFPQFYFCLPASPATKLEQQKKQTTTNGNNQKKKKKKEEEEEKRELNHASE